MLALLPLSGCLVGPQPTGATEASHSSAPEGLVQYFHDFQPDLPISRPPFDQMHVNWKQRIDQPYVFVEYTGSYLGTGRLLPSVHRAMLEQGIEPVGPPFALYYDDPGAVPATQLRSRACMPVDRQVSVAGVLGFDVLPSTTVVYAFAAGPYPEVPRCYPGLYSYMQTTGWIEDGPIRETYLISPSSVRDLEELLCEVQIPVRYGN